MSRVADIIDRAADLLEPEGAWCQTGSWSGRLCVGNALEKAADDPQGFENAIHALYRVVPLRGLSSLIRWNDAPHRTQAEVVATLRHAAKLARGEQP